MAVGGAFAHTGARRHGDGRIFEFAAEAFLKLPDEAAHYLGSAHIVHHETVAHDLGKFQSAGDRFAGTVHHDHHDVRGAEVNAHVKLFAGRDLSNGADAAFELCYAALDSINVHENLWPR